MKNDLKRLHEAAKFFRETAEQCGFDKVVVLWGTVLPNNKITTGYTLSDNIESRDFESLCFRLLGRAYDAVDFDDETL